MFASTIVMLVWEELLHYLGQRLLLLTAAELEHLRTYSLEDVVKHLRDLAAKAQSRNGGSVPTDPPHSVNVPQQLASQPTSFEDGEPL